MILLLQKNESLKRHAIQKAGKVLERNKIVDVNKISAKLKRDFKGVIKSPSYIQNCCKAINRNWLRSYTATSKSLLSNDSSKSKSHVPPLTQQEQSL